MEYPAGISHLAALLADPGRCAMLWSLMDGCSRPASKLALIAGLSASTTSGHLAKLTERGVLALQSQGRNRYYRIASQEIASAIEALAAAAVVSRPAWQASAPAARTVPQSLRRARTCYDHLAGELAVGIYERMNQNGWFSAHHDGRLQLSEVGTAAFSRLGVNVPEARARRRRFACACLDWSERRPHLAGALGAALLDVCRKAGWVAPVKSSRALHVTATGERALARIAA